MTEDHSGNQTVRGLKSADHSTMYLDLDVARRLARTAESK